MSKEFKAGDKVYYLDAKPQIYILEDNIGSAIYPLAIEDTLFRAPFTRMGLSCISDGLPSIFHATEENRRNLSELYGIEFEAPPAKPTSREIIRVKLNKSTEPVPCWVSNDPNCTQPTREDVWAFINKVDTDPSSEIPFLDATGTYWMHATPFNPHTSEAITELPEGD